jgi:hypothetical protein
VPEQPYRTVDKYDRMAGALANLPDATQTKPATVKTIVPLTGESQTFIIYTVRQREVGDTIFLEYGDGDRYVRLYLPPAVADTIARQRDALTTKVRKRVARDQAAARKARGEVPAFLNGKKKQAANRE